MQRRRRRTCRPRRRHRPRPPPQVVDDAVAEILLRLPPDDPSCLARASAVCRAWRCVLADPTFPARYRALHRTPPVLGFFRDGAIFVPTTAFRPRAAGHPDGTVLDCRHGRVLLQNRKSEDLAVWDPITGDLHHLPEVPEVISLQYNSAVLCTVGAGCDHLDCHGGPFVVALVASGTVRLRQIHAFLYSSETGAWSAHASVELDDIPLDSCNTSCLTGDVVPAALVGDALYFIGEFGNEMLRYDLVEPSLLVVDPPDVDIYYVWRRRHAGGGWWAGVRGPQGLPPPSVVYRDRPWWRRWMGKSQALVEMMLPVCNLEPYLCGFVDSTNVIVVTLDDAVFTIELKSLRTRMVCKRDECFDGFLYTCFFTPACASGRLPSPAASGN